jgi:hypothetical protein
MLSDKELYEGFTSGQAEEYHREARQKYGNEIVEQSEQKIRKMSKEKWATIRNEHEIIAQDLAKVEDKDPADPAVQEIIKRHHEWIENFYPAPGSLYRGLGLMYTQDSRFRENYDKHRPGLADFMKKAIDYFCEAVLD